MKKVINQLGVSQDQREHPAIDLPWKIQHWYGDNSTLGFLLKNILQEQLCSEKFIPAYLLQNAPALTNQHQRSQIFAKWESVHATRRLRIFLRKNTFYIILT